MTPLLQSLSHCSPVCLYLCAELARKRAPVAITGPLQLSRSSFTNLVSHRDLLVSSPPRFFLDPSPFPPRIALFFFPFFLSSSPFVSRERFLSASFQKLFPNFSPFPRSINKVSKTDGWHSNELCVLFIYTFAINSRNRTDVC